MTNIHYPSFTKMHAPKKSNVIIGAIYRHPNMDLDEFNDIYLNPILDKISKESKSIFLLGDFNMDLLSYDNHAPTHECIPFLLVCSYHTLYSQLEYSAILKH